jgi:hypothetical protein
MAEVLDMAEELDTIQEVMEDLEAAIIMEPEYPGAMGKLSFII